MRRGTQQADKMKGCMTREAGKDVNRFENIADVIEGSPLRERDTEIARDRGDF